MNTDLAVVLPGEPIALKPEPAAPEPTTARALWPTFMRRTLDEESLRPARLPARPRYAER